MLLLILLLIGSPLIAQVQVRATVGSAVFLDEDFPSHLAVGGSVRLPLTRGWLSSRSCCTGIPARRVSVAKTGFADLQTVTS